MILGTRIRMHLYVNTLFVSVLVKIDDLIPIWIAFFHMMLSLYIE